MLVCGCDPGLGGAICFLRSSPADSRQLDPVKISIAIHDMPTLLLKRGGKSKREVDGHALARIFRRDHPDHVFIELAGAVPRLKIDGTNRKGGQGVSSAFAGGKGYGRILGVLDALEIPYSIIASQVWKKALSVPAAKDGSLARALQLMPSAADQWPLKKHHNRAESALLALYGARLLGSAIQKPAVSPAPDLLFVEAL